MRTLPLLLALLVASIALPARAGILISGTRFVYPFRARLQRTTGSVTAGRINRPIAVRVTFR